MRRKSAQGQQSARVGGDPCCCGKNTCRLGFRDEAEARVTTSTRVAITHHQILMMTAAGVAELAVGALMIGALSPS